MNSQLRISYFQFTILTFVSILIAICGMTAFIFQYSFNKSSTEEVINQAIQWQVKNSGVAALGSKFANRYKQKMRHQMLSREVFDTVVLGSSTVLSVSESHFAVERTVHNAALNSNTLGRVLGEANYVIQNFKSIRWLVVGIDWERGGLLRTEGVVNFTFNPEEVKQIDFFKKLKDSISYARAVIVLKNVLFSDDESYLCKSGLPAIDILEPSHPKQCRGFRHDGSATFAGMNPLTESKSLAMQSEKATALFRDKIGKSGSFVNEEYLSTFTKIDAELKRRGGGLVLLVPPLSPGLARVLELSEIGEALKNAQAKLQSYADTNEISLVDAFRSEDVGCESQEFIDQNHALHSCYEKIFASEEVPDSLRTASLFPQRFGGY